MQQHRCFKSVNKMKATVVHSLSCGKHHVTHHVIQAVLAPVQVLFDGRGEKTFAGRNHLTTSWTPIGLERSQVK